MGKTTVLFDHSILNYHNFLLYIFQAITCSVHDKSPLSFDSNLGFLPFRTMRGSSPHPHISLTCATIRNHNN